MLSLVIGVVAALCLGATATITTTTTEWPSTSGAPAAIWPTTEHAINNGSCPQFPTVQNFDFSRMNIFWYTIFKSEIEKKSNCSCSRSKFTTFQNQTVLASFSAFDPSKNPEPKVVNATFTPVTGLSGTYDVTWFPTPEIETFEFVTAAQRRFYVLDTDYSTYAFVACCYGDGVTYHKTASSVSYFQSSWPQEVKTNATTFFQRLDLDHTLTAINHTDCPTVPGF